MRKPGNAGRNGFLLLIALLVTAPVRVAAGEVEDIMDDLEFFRNYEVIAGMQMIEHGGADEAFRVDAATATVAGAKR